MSRWRAVGQAILVSFGALGRFLVRAFAYLVAGVLGVVGMTLYRGSNAGDGMHDVALLLGGAAVALLVAAIVGDTQAFTRHRRRAAVLRLNIHQTLDGMVTKLENWYQAIEGREDEGITSQFHTRQKTKYLPGIQVRRDLLRHQVFALVQEVSSIAAEDILSAQQSLVASIDHLDAPLLPGLGQSHTRIKTDISLVLDAVAKLREC